MDRKFLWGSATAAYQCEGGWKEGAKECPIGTLFVIVKKTI